MSKNKSLDFLDNPKEDIYSMEDGTPIFKCSRCGQKGFRSVSGRCICTNCANELRRPENIKEAIEKNWLFKDVLPLIKQMNDEPKEISIRCDCGAHYLTLSYWPEDKEKPIVYLTIQLQQSGFWYRLKWALKLLFNKYEGWEGFHIDNKYKLNQLKKFIEEIEKSL